MYKNIMKAYKNGKDDIDRYFRAVMNDSIMENKKNDAIECIYYIGKTFILSLILSADFGEDTSKEREAMKKIKNYLQFDVLGKLEAT